MGWVAGFYPVVLLGPKIEVLFRIPDTGLEGFDVFQIAVCAGAALAYTAALIGLTLPWLRLRKRRGRSLRMAVAGVFVVLASAAFANGGHRLLYDLGFAVWLGYTTTFTFVRYGVLDQERRTQSAGQASSSV